MADEISLGVAELEGKYLTFNLMDEYYGVNVEAILQIIAVPEITMIPKTPPFVKGVINYRGKIIPVVDLRLKFHLPEYEHTDLTSIVIFKIKSSRGELYIGIIVDNVLEVQDIHAHEMENTPAFGVNLDTEFIAGMAKVKGKVMTLLNIDKILLDVELSQFVENKNVG